MPRLENWSVVKDNSNPFVTPELQRIVATGNVYNRDGFEDGASIITSAINTMSVSEGYIATNNTVYKLGIPSSEFVEWLEENGINLEDYEVYQGREFNE